MKPWKRAVIVVATVAALVISGVILLATVVSLLGGSEHVSAAMAAIPSAGEIGSGFLYLLMLMAFLVAYLIPAFVAFTTKHHNAPAIFILNIFLGWTLLGWVAALVWAVTRPAPPPASAPPTP